MVKNLFFLFILGKSIILLGETTYKSPPKNVQKIHFFAKLSPIGSFEGRAIEVLGKLTLDPQKKLILSGEFSVPVEKLTTGNNMRDKHMKEKYLEIGKGFDRITLKIPEQKYEPSSQKNTLKVSWEFHGVVKETSIIVEKISFTQKKDEPQKVNFEIRTELNILDFKIKKPGFLGISMNEIIKLEMSFELVEVETPKKKVQK